MVEHNPSDYILMTVDRRGGAQLRGSY